MTLLRPLAIGIATGARTTVGLAAVARGCGEAAGPLTRAGQPRAALTSTWGVRLSTAGVVSELTADKLPKTPSRLDPPGLVARLLAGVLCALALADRERDPILASVALALGGVGVGALGGAQVRSLAKSRNIPDLPVALAEDAVALGLAAAAVLKR